MPTKLPLIVRPSDLHYDHGEVLPNGSMFFRVAKLDMLKVHWSEVQAALPFACCGTGASSPAMFLGHHEWIFAPTKEALIAAVTRWDELGILARWYDTWAEELEIHEAIEAKRNARRKKKIAEKKWSGIDEIAYIRRTEKVLDIAFKGYWRIDNLPCGLSHFDWFSEHAKPPTDPGLEKQSAALLMQRATYEDWKVYRPLDEVMILEGMEVDRDIEYWKREGDEGRDPYED